MRSFVGSLLAVSLIAVSLAAQAGEAARTPHQIIDALQQRIYVVGETSGKVPDFLQAEANATREIADFIQANKDSEALTALDKSGMTPLMKAAYMGYGDVAQALLSSAAIKAGINAVDAKGNSAWIVSNFALRQSLLACNPAAAQSPFAIVPVLVTQPFYDAKNPYPRIRDLLKTAGAETDMAKAKAAWSAMCVQQANETRAKVTQGADLQTVVMADGKARIAALVQAATQGQGKSR